MENTDKLSLSEFYETFRSLTVKDLEKAILGTTDSDKRGFYRKILNLKLQTEQEKLIGERFI